MSTERIRQRIESLLTRVDSAVEQGDWDTVRARCETVLRLEPSNEDAIAYLKAAQQINEIHQLARNRM